MTQDPAVPITTATLPTSAAAAAAAAAMLSNAMLPMHTAASTQGVPISAGLVPISTVSSAMFPSTMAANLAIPGSSASSVHPDSHSPFVPSTATAATTAATTMGSAMLPAQVPGALTTEQHDKNLAAQTMTTVSR